MKYEFHQRDTEDTESKAEPQMYTSEQEKTENAPQIYADFVVCFDRP